MKDLFKIYDKKINFYKDPSASEITIRETEDGIEIISDQPLPDSIFKQRDNLTFFKPNVFIPALNKAPVNKKTKNKPITPFYLYLTPEGQEILPQLIALMKDEATKAEHYAIMLFALEDLGLLDEEINRISNKSDLHRSIVATFGPKVGKRYTLVKNIERFSGLKKTFGKPKSSSFTDRVKIKTSVEKIKKLIKD